MRRMSFDTRLPALVIAAAVLAAPAAAQEAAAGAGAILSSDISLSEDAARLRLELQSGQDMVLHLDADGGVVVNGDRIASYKRRDALDQAWRSMLQAAMDARPGTLSGLLAGWSPPQEAGAAGTRLDQALETALASSAAAVQAPPAAPTPPPVPGDMGDSIQRLNERIRELEQMVGDPEALEGLRRLEALRSLEELERLEDLDHLDGLNIPAVIDLRERLEDDIREEVRVELRSSGNDWSDGWQSPWRHITSGIGEIFSTLVVYAILVGLGLLAVFFGRKYLEAIADTAREQTVRAGLVGLAGSFLVVPAFILGALALAISIIGIPLLLVYLPLYPVAVLVAALAGYLAIAHGAGEALAERRFTGTDWFARANSYYYIVTGVGLLLVLYFTGSIVGMAGPWLDVLEGLLMFLAVVVTWIAFTIGFGAVLISRAGTRPVAEAEAQAAGPIDLEEEPHV